MSYVPDPGPTNSLSAESVAVGDHLELGSNALAVVVLMQVVNGDDSATLSDGDGSEGADNFGDMKWSREGCTAGNRESDHLFSGLRAGCVMQDHDVTMTLIISGTGLSRKLDFQGRE